MAGQPQEEQPREAPGKQLGTCIGHFFLLNLKCDMENNMNLKREIYKYCYDSGNIKPMSASDLAKSISTIKPDLELVSIFERTKYANEVLYLSPEQLVEAGRSRTGNSVQPSDA